MKSYADNPSRDEWTVKRILDWTTGHLQKHGSDSPRLDAEILLAHARGCQRIELYTRYADLLSDAERARMRELVRRRANAEPVAYLVGYKEFYSLPFVVTPDVLIPRPETEILVLEAIEFAKAAGRGGLRLLDLCTGSGCIAIAAAKNQPELRVTATDLSPAALNIARSNAERNQVAERIEFCEGDLFAPLPSEVRFDIIASNPPYVAQSDYETLPPDILRHEPSLALLAGPDGLDLLRRIASEARAFLNPGGLLLLELAPEQAETVAGWLRGSFAEVTILKDFAGEARVVRGRMQSIKCKI